jgi:2-polyprenyl-3-methyl-5-hydroxy-6-metoxy-1,4-benzoquinol methylase
MNEINLQDEVFCLRFELNILGEVLLKNEAERWVPGFIYQNVEHDHIKRYELAGKYVKDKAVLDIACGVGRGSYYLAETGKANSVTGCDLSADAVRYAKYRNAHPLVDFQIQDAEEYIAANAFDVIVSFETIEHLKRYDQFLRNISASLKENGLLIVSTPVSGQPLNTTPVNPYHIQEWGFQSFQDVISKYFFVTEIYVQLYHLPKPVYIKHDFFSRASRSIKRRLKIKKTVIAENIPVNENKFSVLERFTNQYPLDELGNNWIGYQIIIAKKNG